MTTLIETRTPSRANLDEPVMSLGDTDLVDGYVENRRRLTRMEADTAAMLAEIDRRRAYEPDFFTTEAFLQQRVGDSGRAARRHVAEARALREYPEVAAAYSSAEIDHPRVSMLLSAARVAPQVFRRDVNLLVETASGMSMAGTYRALEYWKQQADLAAVEADADHLHRRRHLHAASTHGGMIHIQGELDPVGGTTVLVALRSLADPGNLEAGDDRTPGQRRADALVELCADHLQHGTASEAGGSKPQVTVTVSLDALAHRNGPGGELADGTVITPETARRIVCDASVSRVITRGESEILDVGRATRVVPAAIRRALALRDKGCTHPGCDRPPHWCDAHHIVHWVDGGETRLDNLVLLCRRHHRAAHDADRSTPP